MVDLRRLANKLACLRRRALPAGWRDALRQVLILASCYAVYDLARLLVHGREAAAMANAQTIINAEKSLHLYVEPAVQTAAGHVHAVVASMDWFYANVHLPATILTLVLIYLYRHETFVSFRNAFLAMNALALTFFALFPVAPPRLVPTSGVVDTLYLYSTTNYRSGVLSMVTDQYAAFPSLHIGYALFLSIAVWLLTGNRSARALAAVYPVVVLAVVVITGNHYLIDVVGGVAVVSVAFALTRGFAPQVAPAPLMVRVCDDERSARAVGPRRGAER